MFPYAEVLYDQEAESSGVYMPYLPQPEHCNANSTALWELYALRVGPVFLGSSNTVVLCHASN